MEYLYNSQKIVKLKLESSKFKIPVFYLPTRVNWKLHVSKLTSWPPFSSFFVSYATLSNALLTSASAAVVKHLRVSLNAFYRNSASEASTHAAQLVTCKTKRGVPYF